MENMIRALRARETRHRTRRCTLEALMEARRAHLRALFREATDALVRDEMHTAGSDIRDQFTWVRNRQRAIFIKVWRVGLRRTLEATILVRRTWIQAIASYDIDDRSIEWFHDDRVKRHCSLRTSFGAFLRDLFERPERVALSVH
jgi:hypothetical protein